MVEWLAWYAQGLHLIPSPKKKGHREGRGQRGRGKERGREGGDGERRKGGRTKEGTEKERKEGKELSKSERG